VREEEIDVSDQVLGREFGPETEEVTGTGIRRLSITAVRTS
jgi:hypothetical protein